MPPNFTGWSPRSSFLYILSDPTIPCGTHCLRWGALKPLGFVKKSARNVNCLFFLLVCLPITACGKSATVSGCMRTSAGSIKLTREWLYTEFNRKSKMSHIISLRFSEGKLSVFMLFIVKSFFCTLFLFQICSIFVPIGSLDVYTLYCNVLILILPEIFSLVWPINLVQ